VFDHIQFEDSGFDKLGIVFDIVEATPRGPDAFKYPSYRVRGDLSLMKPSRDEHVSLIERNFEFKNKIV
jgi:hypothetical protein